MLRIGGHKLPKRLLLLLGFDIILVNLGLVFAAAVRFEDGVLTRAYLHGPLTVRRFAVILTVCMLAYYYNDLYDSQVLRQHGELFIRMFQASGIACLALAIIYYFDENLSPGRGIAILAAMAILTLTMGSRLVLEKTRLFTATQERILLLGTGQLGIALVREMIARPELNLKVIGFLDEKGENIGKRLVNPGIIGAAMDVEAVTQRENVDRVILSLAERRGQTPVRELLRLKFMGVAVEDAHTVFESITGRIQLEQLSPSWLILSDGFRKSSWVLGAKRIGDIVISLLVLALIWPLLALVGAAIWLETGAPIFFRQERTGLKGKSFEMLKFRSMRQDAEKDGPSWASEQDNRVTRVGRFIRKCRLDEFPQLLNVVRGDMSLVGPRPERPYFCRMLEEQVPYFALRHSVRPGITGWAQIKYQYGACVEDAKVKMEFDLFYVKHLSPILDLFILFDTAKVMLLGRGAK
jgi:sugar transferase (PEP-CTERM system associated)